MYHLHITADKCTEHEENDENLDKLVRKKLDKLITQIKTKKIIDPSIDTSIVSDLENFKEGELMGSIPGIRFIIKKNDNSFYLEKIFTNDKYVTLRYYSRNKDDNYDRVKDEMLIRKDYILRNGFEIE